jgi:hypothetical protein
MAKTAIERLAGGTIATLSHLRVLMLSE